MQLACVGERSCELKEQAPWILTCQCGLFNPTEGGSRRLAASPSATSPALPPDGLSGLERSRAHTHTPHTTQSPVRVRVRHRPPEASASHAPAPLPHTICPTWHQGSLTRCTKGRAHVSTLTHVDADIDVVGVHQLDKDCY